MENGKMLSTSSKLPLLYLVNDIRIFKYRCQFEARVNLFVGCAYFMYMELDRWYYIVLTGCTGRFGLKPIFLVFMLDIKMHLLYLWAAPKEFV